MDRLTVYVRKVDENRRSLSVSPFPVSEWREWLINGFALDGNSATKVVTVDALLDEERRLAERFELEFR